MTFSYGYKFPKFFRYIDHGHTTQILKTTKFNSVRENRLIKNVFLQGKNEANRFWCKHYRGLLEANFLMHRLICRIDIGVQSPKQNAI